jgi:hypothetical protein
MAEPPQGFVVPITGIQGQTLYDGNGNPALKLGVSPPTLQNAQLLDASGNILVDLTTTNAASTMATGPLDLVLDAKRDFGAAGSNQSTTGSITAGSTTLTVASTIDFRVGQGISVGGAGISGSNLVSKIVAISGTTITLQGAAGTTVTNAGVNHDDTAALQAWANVSGKHYLPSGTYNLSSSVTLGIGDYDCDTGAIIQSNGAPGDAILLASGNWGGRRVILPDIVGFTSGAALHVVGAAQAYIYVANISSCLSGILIESTTTQQTVNDTFEFWGIGAGVTYAIHFKAADSTHILQGHLIRGNFINGNKVGIYLDAPNGSTPAWQSNIIDVPSIDGDGAPGTYGIYCPNSALVNGISFRCAAFFGGFTSGYVIMSNANGVNFELYFASTPTASQMTVVGNNNTIVNTNERVETPLNAQAITAATASGSQSTFNGGALLVYNRTRILLPVPALTAGQTADFYIYHAFTTGYTNNVRVTPRYSAPFVVVAVEDESVVAGVDGLTSANQVHIRILATGSVAAGNYEVDVEVYG